MLELKEITKDYYVADMTVHALKGVSLKFRKSEFVSILGASGCGKTTLLNIIGGLDRYTSGDLVIGGKSTREYKDADWDSYRNHSIGFVFQSYNLIPHQTVLENVELALTLSGVGKAERRERAKQVLVKVGLGDKLGSKPNQLSGGQMQRVAIARALVNDPEILLADEPTGALDSTTSVQIMELLREIAGDRLIIMVTHNPELARKYSNRIINLHDGELIGDSNPLTDQDEIELKRAIDERRVVVSADKAKRRKKTHMSLATALGLSFKNLLTKKARTIMVGIAGSIGIVGIALILALSSGFQAYINNVQEDALSSYPITVSRQTMDMSSMLLSFMGKGEKVEHDLGDQAVYSNDIMGNVFGSIFSSVRTNDMRAFKQYVEQHDMSDILNAIKYGYDIDFEIYASDTTTGVRKLNLGEMLDNVLEYNLPNRAMFDNVNAFEEMLDNQKLLERQYEVLKGSWPTAYNEVVLVTDKNNEISDMMLYAIGLKSEEELRAAVNPGSQSGKPVEHRAWTYDELLGVTFKMLLPTDYYTYDAVNKVWVDNRGNKEFVASLLGEKAITIKVVGIVRPQEDASNASISGAIAYTSELTRKYISLVGDSEIVKAQRANPQTDIFTGQLFRTGELSIEQVNAMIEAIEDPEQKMMIKALIASMTQGMDEETANKATIELAKKYLISSNTYEGNMTKLGVADLDDPATISFYPIDFASKDKLIDFIEQYNAACRAEGNEDAAIKYTDYLGVMLSSISTIIDAISYVLMGFVSVSLIVSSIMIGVITSISVLERTKEIGILRAIGASKRDISRVFNAETITIGLLSGIIGVGITLLLTIPVNIIISSLASIPNVAKLPMAGAVILIAISMILTFVAGLIPSGKASRKDPVIALRTE